MNIAALDTPTLAADLDVLERNINGMATHCHQLGIPLRVHTKTHKVPEIAQLQVAAGSQGITCQKLGEAEVMVDAGIDNILIPYNIVGTPKLKRLTALVQRAKIIPSHSIQRKLQRVSLNKQVLTVVLCLLLWNSIPEVDAVVCSPPKKHNTSHNEL